MEDLPHSITAFGLIYDQGERDEATMRLCSIGKRVQISLEEAIQERGMGLHYEQTILEDDYPVIDFVKDNPAELYILITDGIDTDVRPRNDVFAIIETRAAAIALLSRIESEDHEQAQWAQDFGQQTRIHNYTRGTRLVFGDFVSIPSLDALHDTKQAAKNFGEKLIQKSLFVHRLLNDIPDER